MEEDVYDRQKNLSVLNHKNQQYIRRIPQKVTVVGLGGIGSWVALDMAIAGVPNLVLIDSDSIEKHNLNRTPFKDIQVGMNKADAVNQLILERRNTKVTVYNKAYELLPSYFRHEIADSYLIDCRDNLDELPYEVQKKLYLRYDGISMTVMRELPDQAFVPHTRGYDIVPSILMPPQMLSAIATFIVLYDLSVTTATFDLFDLIEKLGIVYNNEEMIKVEQEGV